MKKKTMKKIWKEKGWLVSGIWGTTIFSPIKNIAEKEYQRLERGEFSPTITKVTITYSLPTK